MKLNQNEKTLYSRHLLLSEIGIEGQEKRRERQGKKNPLVFPLRGAATFYEERVRKKERLSLPSSLGWSCIYARVYAGYECAGYPDSFADFACPVYQLPLYIEPKPAGIQVTMEGNTLGDVCSKEVEVSIEVVSTKLAVADSIEVKLALPPSQGIVYQQASSAFKYPLTTAAAAIDDPAQAGDELTFTIGDLNSSIAEEGLPGVTDLSANRFELSARFTLSEDFVPGDYIIAQVSAKQACGSDLPTINLAYDPSVKFSENTSEWHTCDSSSFIGHFSKRMTLV